MKTIFQLILVTLIALPLYGQNTLEDKARRAAADVNMQATQMAQTTQDVSFQTQSAGQQVYNTIANVKSIIRVFEPIFHLRRKRVASTDSMGMVQPMSSSTEMASMPVAPSMPMNTDPMATAPVTSGSMPSQVMPVANSGFVPESNLYNPDGSANLGNQNHEVFGSYIDVVRGQILDDITVATSTRSVDLIFTATDHFNSQLPMYALLTPAYVKNDLAANYYFRGPKYKDQNVPPRIWPQVNESEIALTPISGIQFERIQDNNQLMAIVRQTQGFKSHFESRTKLTGKVFAIKTEMGSRTCYGLLYVTNHFGTTGTNGYLTVKLKVTGFDANGDGYPDPSLYSSN